MSDLHVDSLCATYGKTRVLEAVTLTVAQGESVAVLGANGAGKSTLLKSICGLVRPAGGAITYAGSNIAHLSPSATLARGVAYVPERREIFLRMTVRENLLLGATTRPDRHAVSDDIAELCELFPVVGAKLDAQGGHLSGGQQALVGIARALMARPSLLLLDEPSLGLAPRLVEELGGHLERVQKQYGMGLLIVEQNAGVALRVAGRAHVLKAGRFVMEASSAELKANDLLWRTYLGASVDGGTSNVG